MRGEAQSAGKRAQAVEKHRCVRWTRVAIIDVQWKYLETVNIWEHLNVHNIYFSIYPPNSYIRCLRVTIHPWYSTVSYHAAAHSTPITSISILIFKIQYQVVLTRANSLASSPSVSDLISVWKKSSFSRAFSGS